MKLWTNRHPDQWLRPAEQSGGSSHLPSHARSHQPFRPRPSGPARHQAAAGVAKLLSIAALSIVTTLTGCKSTPPPKPLAQLTAQEQAGHAAYLTNCAQCHYDRQDGALRGPSLLGVYKKPYLPSGAPANDDRIRNTILHGRGNMPALGGAIADSDITDILVYLKTL